MKDIFGMPIIERNLEINNLKKENKTLISKIKQFRKIFRKKWESEPDCEPFYPDEILYIINEHFKNELNGN
jgi:hypothetical protein